MEPKVVFFGEANHGKSTVIGYLYATTAQMDMDRAAGQLQQRLGRDYDPRILYSSLINPDIVEGITTTQTVEVENPGNLREGVKILKDNEDERVIQTTALFGATAKIITTTHKKKFIQGLNSIVRHLRNIRIDDAGEPVKITMIDTPGQADYLSERETGMSMGDIGVFCMETRRVLADDFDGLMFEFSDLFSQYNQNAKLIYLLTKFDDGFDGGYYTEADYKEACRRINEYCKRVKVEFGDSLNGVLSVAEADAAAIIPVAVECANRHGVNLIAHAQQTPWYQGPTLIDAIKQQMFELADVYRATGPENLLFSIDKEIARPRSQAGKVWRIHIRNGSLNVDDGIMLTEVNLKGRPRGETYNITAAVKSIHEELSVDEAQSETQTAYRGSIVTVDLKSCYAEGRRIDKGDIMTTNSSIGLAEGEPVKLCDKLYIKFEDPEKALPLVNEGQEIILLWFGKKVTADITAVPDTLDGIHVQLKYGKRIALPADPALQDIQALKNIKIRTQYGNRKIGHFSGVVEFGC